MWANMKAQFVIDGPRIHLDRIDLETDGATTVAQRRRRHRPLAEAELQRAVAREFPAHARAVLQGRRRGASAATATSPACSSCSRPATDQSRSRPAPSRATLAASTTTGSRRSTARCAGRSTASTSGTPARSSTAATRSSSIRIKPFGAKVRPTHRFEPRVTERRSRAVHRLRAAARACGSPGAATLRNMLEWPSGRFVEHRGEGSIVVAPPPGVAPMTASLAAAARGRRDHAATMGPVRADAAAGASADRGRADATATARTTSTIEQAGSPPSARYVDVRRHDRIRRAIAAAVPRRRAATGRKAIRCSPASSPISVADRRRCRSAGAASSTA